jgi:hypothetical protein
VDANEITIDPEFESLLPSTDATEDALLEQSIIETQGPRDPLTLWGDSNILIDGHRRLNICKKHNLPFQVVREELESAEDVRIWMLLKQISRRNVMDKHRPRLVTELYERVRDQSQRGDGNAAERVAGMIGTTRRNVYRHVSKHRLIAKLIPGWQVHAERIGMDMDTAQAISNCNESDQAMLLEACVGNQTSICSSRELKQRVMQALEIKKRKKPLPLPFKVELPPEVEIGEFVDPTNDSARKKVSNREVSRKIAEAEERAKELKQLVEEVTSRRYVDSGVMRQRMLTSVSRVAQCLKFMSENLHERTLN